MVFAMVAPAVVDYAVPVPMDAACAWAVVGTASYVRLLDRFSVNVWDVLDDNQRVSHAE